MSENLTADIDAIAECINQLRESVDDPKFFCNLYKDLVNRVGKLKCPETTLQDMAERIYADIQFIKRFTDKPKEYKPGTLLFVAEMLLRRCNQLQAAEHGHIAGMQSIKSFDLWWEAKRYYWDDRLTEWDILRRNDIARFAFFAGVQHAKEQENDQPTD